jgi:hypothetical protein
VYRAARAASSFALALALAAPAAGWEPDRAGFAVRVKGQVSRHTVLGVFVLPGEVLRLAVEPRDAGAGTYALEWVAAKAVATGPASFTWRAPGTPGLYPLRLVQQPSGRAMTFNVFVMVPATRLAAGELNGYQVGDYPAHPFQGLTAYLPPRGFVEVTEELRAVRVAPHFTLGQFASRQPAPFPKYLALQERLLLKLELILERLAAAGHPADTLFVQSGYRTPFHNHARGQGVYSRHIYGDAADIFVDRDGDGRMDDLDRSGRADDADARALAALVERIERRAGYTGGLGVYPGTSDYGPYLHVDARGTPARWSASAPQVAQAPPREPHPPATTDDAVRGAPQVP